MQFFYCQNIQDTFNTLTPEESRHCIKSLRLKAGDEIFITDGLGGLFKAMISKANSRRCEYKIEEQLPTEHKNQPLLHMAVAMTKNTSRFEWFIEKATEIGVDEISPMICEKSERSVANVNRLTGIMVSAIKQSRRAWLPKLNNPKAFRTIISESNNYQGFIAWFGTGDHNHLNVSCQQGTNTLVLIGPEGDFTDDEVNVAIQHDISPVSLGNFRLRTETAALVAVQTFNLINQ